MVIEYTINTASLGKVRTPWQELGGGGERRGTGKDGRSKDLLLHSGAECPENTTQIALLTGQGECYHLLQQWRALPWQILLYFCSQSLLKYTMRYWWSANRTLAHFRFSLHVKSPVSGLRPFIESEGRVESPLLQDLFRMLSKGVKKLISKSHVDSFFLPYKTA